MISCNNEDSAGSPEETNTDNETEEAEQKEPITLKIGVHFDDTMFNERFKEPIEENFPHITVEHVPIFTYGRGDLEELFFSGETADFFFTISQEDMEYFELDSDLSELIEEHDYDTSHLNQNLLDTIRARDSEGRLTAWPYEDTYYVLAYNKEIFDMFGENYPSDDMTWEETIELATRLTQERNGVKYRGLDFADNDLLTQFSINATDPETGEVLILEKPEFSQYVDLFDRIFNIPGIYDDGNLFHGDGFSNDHTTAMLVVNAQALNWWKDNEGLNFDVATVPTWSSHPNIAPRGFLQTLTLNPMSEHKDEVFEVFTYFASDDYQKWMSRNGIGIVSNQKEILDEFYQDYENTHDMNVSSIFNNEAAPPPERISLWDKYVDINLQDFYESTMDPNEFLRVSKEEAEAEIKEAKEME